MKILAILFAGLIMAGCYSATHIDTLVVDKNDTGTYVDLEGYDSNRSIRK